MIYLIGLLSVTGLAMAFVPSSEDRDDPEASSAGPDTDVEEETSAAQADADDGDSLLDMVAAGLRDTPLPDGEAEILNGGPDAETLVGGDGNDSIAGRSGDDELLGGDGEDTLAGGAGDDIAVSDGGDDVLFGGAGDDALHARAGNDLIHGGDGQDSLFGGQGDDTLFGGDEEDYLIGAEGNDALLVGAGDHAHGGHGHDSFFLTDTGASDAVAELMDFNSDEDVVVLLVDEGQADAELTMTLSENDSQQTEIRLDGQVIATLATEGAPGPADIRLLVSPQI